MAAADDDHSVDHGVEGARGQKSLSQRDGRCSLPDFKNSDRMTMPRAIVSRWTSTAPTIASCADIGRRPYGISCGERSPAFDGAGFVMRVWMRSWRIFGGRGSTGG